MNHINVRRFAFACLLVCAVPGAVLAADENVIDVTTRLDTIDAFDQLCSLREALMNANTNKAFSPVADECPAGSGTKTDVIVLHTTDDDKHYHLTLTGPGDNAGDLDIHDNPGVPADVDDLRIEAGGESYFTRITQGVAHQRVLENHLARTAINGIQLWGGSADQGGGIRNVGGVMLLERVEVVENEAAENGGGIYNAGVMRLEDTDVWKNESGLHGGGIFNEGEMTIRGGGSSASHVGQSLAGSFGGGIYNAKGTMLLDGIDLQQNRAVVGGSIYNLADLTVANDSIVWISKAALAGGGIANAGDAKLSVIESRVGGLDESNGNTAGGPGGAIANLQNASLTLRNALVTQGYAGGDGGGIYSDSTQPISISESRLEDNIANGDGGGLYLNPTAETTSKATLLRSLVAGNYSGGDGGGVWFGATASAQLANSTVSGNTVSGTGAALFVDAGGVIEAESLTIFAGDNEPAIISFGTLSMRNSIVHAPGEDGACDSGGDPSSNVITSLGHNMFSDYTCAGLDAFGDNVGIDPMLAPLGDNGGPTQTHALQGFSPAIDAGDDAACAAAAVGGVDQRGAPRPFGFACDIGAHEQGAKIQYPLFADGFE